MCSGCSFPRLRGASATTFAPPIRAGGTPRERLLKGTPVLEGDVQIVDCDFSANGEGGPDDVGGARLLASWRKGAAS